MLSADSLFCSGIPVSPLSPPPFPSATLLAPGGGGGERKQCVVQSDEKFALMITVGKQQWKYRALLSQVSLGRGFPPSLMLRVCMCVWVCEIPLLERLRKILCIGKPSEGTKERKHRASARQKCIGTVWDLENDVLLRIAFKMGEKISFPPLLLSDSLPPLLRVAGTARVCNVVAVWFPKTLGG